MIMIKTDFVEMKISVLVLEDDIELRFLLADTLRNAGFKVIEAGTSDEALTFLRTSKDVSLVFADIKVPGESDGIGLMERMRREFPAIKVILTSGHEMREAAPPGVRFLQKPYILSRVISEIRSLLLEPKAP